MKVQESPRKVLLLEHNSSSISDMSTTEMLQRKGITVVTHLLLPIETEEGFDLIILQNPSALRLLGAGFIPRAYWGHTLIIMDHPLTVEEEGQYEKFKILPRLQMFRDEFQATVEAFGLDFLMGGGG